jgi:hypothetical protein
MDAARRARPGRLVQSHYEWWAQQLGPVLDQVRSRGIIRAAPASLMVAAGSFLATAAVRISTPWQNSATELLSYKGEDLYAWQLWKLISSGLLALSWPQWLWTLFVAVVLFAALEVRVGSRRLIACILLSHVVPTVVVALLAPAIGERDLLTHVDYGTSCLVVGAAAALAWVRRSALLAGVMVVSLATDAFLSAPSTAVEHCLAVTIGAAVAVAGSPRLRSSANGCRPGPAESDRGLRSSPHTGLCRLGS